MQLFLNDEWVTFGVHNGQDSNKGKACGALITDDVFLNFILPVIDKLSFDFGKCPKKGDVNKAKASRKEGIDVHLQSRLEEMNLKVRVDEKEEILIELDN